MAKQLEDRASFRNVQKKTIQKEMKNGGAINLRFVASYSPYKFYPKEDYRPGKQKR